MKALIIGRGGREHALAWKAAQSPKVSQIFVAPGNAGTALEPKIQNIDIDENNFPALIQFAQHENIALTIVGPEAPLALGIVDAFQKANLACLGPSQAAAQLESSKAFSKAFMQRHNIPTAAYQSFTSQEEAKHFINSQTHFPWVIKADGLAAGKGVIIANTKVESLDAIDYMFSGSLAEAGYRVVIEEFLIGEEASFIALCDGHQVLALTTSQDHKTRDEGDIGPNTGGMGAYSPAPVITPALEQRIMEEIIYPTLQGMASEGMPYVGFLYVGVMIDTKNNPWVLEFNCRLGDPETQALMLRLRSDFIEICQAALSQQLNKIKMQWDPRPALGVVLASGGYPNAYQSGYPIQGLPEQESSNLKVFHAGTALKDGHIVTAGGRVLCATALGDTVVNAQAQAYQLATQLHWENVYYRRDIGYRAVNREREKQV